MRIDQELSKGIGGMGGGFSAAPMMMDDDDMMFRRQSQRRRDPGASGGRGAGPNPATVVDDTDPRIDRLRRILRFRLACIQSALAGTKTGGGLVGQVATDAQKAEVDRVITAIVSVVEVIDRGNSDLSALLKSITDRANTALQDIDKVVAAK